MADDTWGTSRKSDPTPRGEPWLRRASLGSGKSRRGSLLCVDDEPCLGRIYATVLGKMAGYAVHTALNAYDGFRILGAHEIDVLVTNIRMPVMDGLKMAELVRLEFPAVAVIICTAYGVHDCCVRAAEVGCSDVEFKPFKIPYLTASVANAVRLGPGWKSEVVRALLAGAGAEGVRELMARRRGE